MRDLHLSLKRNTMTEYIVLSLSLSFLPQHKRSARHAVNVEEMSSSPQHRSHPPLMQCRHKSQGGLGRGPASSTRQGPSLGNKWETHTDKHTRAESESHQSSDEKTSVNPNPPFLIAET